MSRVKQKLQNAVEKVADGLQDLTTLSVVTYTGDVSVEFSEGKLDLDKLQPKATSLQVAAMTQISLDQDISQVRFDVEAPEGLFELHESAVKTAIEARASLVRMMIEMVASL